MSTIDYKTKIKCAVFDLDGTLLNSIKTINYYLNFALTKNGLGSVSEADTATFVGDGARMLVSRALNRLGEGGADLFDRVFADYNAAYDADPYYLTEVYRGIPELLSALREGGITLAVLSNKPDFATRAAVSHFFGDTFAATSGAKEGVRLKPYPDSLLNMLGGLGISPDETVYIGDSDQDINTARNASVAGCISVAWGFRSREQLISSGATHLVDRPKQINDIICLN
jgi:phosphoglycolate phosphatase